MTKNNKTKVLRNLTIPTYHVVEARRPDTVVLSKMIDQTVVRDKVGLTAIAALG